MHNVVEIVEILVNFKNPLKDLFSKIKSRKYGSYKQNSMKDNLINNISSKTLDEY